MTRFGDCLSLRFLVGHRNLERSNRLGQPVGRLMYRREGLKGRSLGVQFLLKLHRPGDDRRMRSDANDDQDEGSLDRRLVLVAASQEELFSEI